MVRIAGRILVSSLLLAGGMPLLAAPLQVKTVFRTGVYSDSIGSANLVARDVTGDDIADAISCSAGAAFVVSKVSTGLAPVWFSEARGCTAVTAGDTDADGHEDVIVAGTVSSGYYYSVTAGTLAVYDPRTFARPRAEVRLPKAEAPTDVALGDTDHDGKPEIVLITNQALYVYDAKTLSLKWSVAGKGGRKVFIADLEGDGQNEIVVSSGHILDGVTRTEKWGYVGGFGSAFAVGDVDADGKAEIVFQSSSGVATIIDGDTMATRTVNLTVPIDSLTIGDAKNDGAQEIIVGANQWGAIKGIRPSDGVVLWSVNNPDYGVSAIAVGDVTGDGSRDVLWGAGLGSSGRDVMFVANPNTSTITWNSVDLDAYLGGVVADLDGDGKPELILKSEQSESGYSAGVLQIFDLETRRLKTTLHLTGSASSMRIQRIAVGQLDADPALEIAVLGPSYYDPYLTVLDGVTGAQEYLSPYSGYGNPGFTYPALAIANVDGDPVDEILVGTSDSHLEALNGATNFVQWTSGILDGQIRDCSVADVDNDGVKEVVVATTTGFYVLNASTGVELLHTLVSGGVSRVSATSGGFGVASSAGPVSFYSSLLTPNWTCARSQSQVATALVFTLVGSQACLVSGEAGGTLRVYPVDGQVCPAAEVLTGGTDSINDLGSADVTGDGKPELVVSRGYSVDVESLITNHCDAASPCPAITLGAATTDATGMTFTGTATSPVALASVRYETTGATVASGAGTIAGSGWTVGPLPLVPGATTITVTVTDANDNSVVSSYSMAGGYLPALPPGLPPVGATPGRTRAVGH